VKVALAQINPTIGDFTGNTEKILSFASRAAKQGAELVVFPELAVCGYPPADLLEKDAFLVRAQLAVDEIALWTAEKGRPALLVGSVMRTGNAVGKHVRNVAVLLDGGKQRFVQQKMLLPFYDVFDEQRYFEPAATQSLTEVAGQPLAITICEDAWNDKNFWPRRLYSLDPVDRLMEEWVKLPQADNDVRIILNISASPYWTGKPAMRERMLAAIAKRHQAHVILVNQVGGNDSLIFDGASIALSPEGQAIVRCDAFVEDLAVIDLPSNAPLAETRSDEIAEMWEALVLGTRDYVRKCGFNKVAVGLSGGIDSALVAAIAV